MNLLAKVLFRYSSPLLALVALQPAIFATVDDAQSFALQAAEPYVKQGFQVREDYWEATSLRVKKKRCDSNCSKGTNTGSGWEPKSIGRRCPFIFTIRTGSWRKNQTAGRKVILRLRTSFQRPRAVTLSSSASRNRQRTARIGHWCMVSGRVWSVALALSQYAIGKGADAAA